MCSFKLKMQQNPFSAGALARNPLGRLTSRGDARFHGYLDLLSFFLVSAFL